MTKRKDTPPAWANGLKAQERLFVEAFLINGRAGPAYQKIAPGVSAKSASETGHRWRKRLASAIARATEERSELLRGTLVETLKIRASYDIGDFIHADGTPKFESLNELSAEERLAIDSIVTRHNDKGYRMVEVKFADRHRAVNTLCKIAGLLKPNQLTVNNQTNVANFTKSEIDPAKFLMEKYAEIAKRREQEEQIVEIQPPLTITIEHEPSSKQADIQRSTSEAAPVSNEHIYEQTRKRTARRYEQSALVAALRWSLR